MLANRLDILRFSAPGYMIGAALCHARLLDLQDSPRSALAYLAQKEAHFRTLGLDRGTARMLDEQLRITLKCNDWRHAESLLALLDDLARNHRGASSCDGEIMTLAALSEARLTLARRQSEAALQVLDIADRHASELGRGQWRVKVELLRAFALAELERKAEALEHLRSAVASGYRLGLVRTFVDEGEAFQSLLPQLDLAEDAVLGGYYRKLAVAAPELSSIDAAEGLSPVIETNREQVSLTRREQDIIDLLEQSMSNKRIALALNLSLQTVKWNLKNIFFKFAVSSRYDAIVVARRRREGGAG